MSKVVGDIAIDVSADVGPLVTSMGKGTASVSRFGKTADNVTRSLRRLAPAIGAAMGALASGAGFSAAIREAEKFQTTMFRVDAIIRATGGAAGRSAEQLREQARQIARSTLESTEGVLQAQQTLLTFRKVQGEVFDRAIVAATDMAAALGGDLNSATLQLAKALENPLEGISALSRSGTVFTKSQKEMVQGMVETGKIAEAQNYILSELEAQYKGTAEAAAGGFAGAQDTLSQSMQEFKLELAESLGLLRLATAANHAVAAAVDFLAERIDAARGYFIAAAVGLTAYFTPALIAATARVGLFIASLVTLKGALISTGIGAFVVVGGTLVNVFLKLSEAAGSFGIALGMLVDVGKESFERIAAHMTILKTNFQLIINDIQFAWVRGLGKMQAAFAAFLDGIAAVAPAFMNLEGGNAQAVAAQMADQMKSINDEMVGILDEQDGARDVLAGPMESLQAIRDMIASMKEEGNTLDGIFGAPAEGDDTEGKGSAAKAAADEAIEQLDRIKQAQDMLRSSSEGMWGAMGGFLQEFAGKSKVAAIAVIAINKALAIAQAIQNTAVAVTKALTIDPTGSLAARVAAMGKIQVGLIAATGLAQAAGAGRSGGGAGGGGGGGGVASQPSANTSPRVALTLQGQMFSAGQVRELINAINEEVEGGSIVRLA